MIDFKRYTPTMAGVDDFFFFFLERRYLRPRPPTPENLSQTIYLWVNIRLDSASRIHDDEHRADNNGLNSSAEDWIGYDGQCFVDNHVCEEKCDEKQMPVFANGLDLIGVSALISTVKLRGVNFEPESTYGVPLTVSKDWTTSFIWWRCGETYHSRHSVAFDPSWNTLFIEEMSAITLLVANGVSKVKRAEGGRIVTHIFKRADSPRVGPANNPDNRTSNTMRTG